MSTSDSLRRLADWVSALEAAGFDVGDLRPSGESVVRDGVARAELSVRTRLFSTLDDCDTVSVQPSGVRVTDDGWLAIDLALEVSPDGTSPDPTVETALDAEDPRGGDGSPNGEAPTGAAGGSTADSGNPDAADGSGGEPNREPGASRADPGRADDGGELTDGTSVDADGRSSGEYGKAADRQSEPADVSTDDADGESGPPSENAGDADGESGSSEGDESVGDDSGTDEDVPVHRDPERLRGVYSQDRTFEEMRDALGAEVTPQTVRKHMIKHGIHEPESRAKTVLAAASASDGSPSQDPSSERSTSPADDGSAQGPSKGSSSEETDVEPSPPGGSPGEELQAEGRGEESDVDESPAEGRGEESDVDESPAEERGEGSTDAGDTSPPDPADDQAIDDVELEAVSDGVGLPSGLTLDDVRSAVHRGRTIDHVRRQLDIDRETTRDLLQKLNLLELVTGRVAARGQVDDSMEAIDRRIREATGNLPPA